MRATYLALAALAHPTRADADEPTHAGFAAALVDGVTGFTDPAMRSTASPGLLWGVRVTAGSRLPIAIEVNYLGSERGVVTPVTRDGSLESAVVDTALRFTPLPRHAWSPYAFAGVGWQRFDLDGALLTVTGAMPRTTSTTLVIPTGAGVLVRIASPIAVDVRGTYRISQSSSLIPDASGHLMPMNAWEASASLVLEL